MKKKLNLLWNLKFNFFSVAERPLTFFAYFLNAKKVGRRRLVISPAKAGAFLFSHTRLPFPPRPLLPFGRISPAAKPGWPVIGPTGADVLPFPSRLRRAGTPPSKSRRSSARSSSVFTSCPFIFLFPFRHAAFPAAFFFFIHTFSRHFSAHAFTSSGGWQLPLPKS